MDFEEDSGIKVSEDKLKDLSKLATQQLLIEQSILAKKEELEQLTKILKHLSETKIPEAMQAIGMSKFSLTNGAEIIIKPFYSGNLGEKNPRAAEGYTWLRDNGHGGLIKKNLNVEFGQLENVNWNDLILAIRQSIHENIGVEAEGVELNEGVHHATLNAFIREQIEGGKEFPLELFNAYVGNRAKISLK